MRRDGLVPLEKSRRVIRINKRGRAPKGHPVVAGIFGVLGMACILYCAGIAAFGFGTYFFLIWGAFGAGFLVLCLVLRSGKLMAILPGWFKVACCLLFLGGALLFGGVEAAILSWCGARAEPGADYLLVLGAQWKETGPSEVLRYRLDAAAGYLAGNPDTKAIVSGGQGRDESMTEAAGMRSYLLEAGIEEERILVEEASTDTYENIVFSGTLLDREADRVVVVTNDFHMFRAAAIARKQGYARVEGLSAGSLPGMLPHNLLREFFGVVKDFWAKHL